MNSSFDFYAIEAGIIETKYEVITIYVFPVPKGSQVECFTKVGSFLSIDLVLLIWQKAWKLVTTDN